MVPDQSNIQRASNRETEASMNLSRENLRRFESSQDESDTHYAENVVMAEGERLANEEISRKRDSGCAFDTHEEEKDTRASGSVDGLKMPKRPRASLETPFRRYVTIGPGEDPFPLYGKQEMAAMPVKYGSLEGVGARRDAAIIIEQNVKKTRAKRRTV